MDKKKHIVCLVLFLFGAALAEKNEWHEKENDLQGLIDIDEDKGMYEGSGNELMNDDDDMSEGSGGDKHWNMDMEDDEDEDEDEDESETGSAEMESQMTDCWKVKMQVGKMENPPYEPKCTQDGLFEIVQCHENYQQCFCVDTYGRKIIGTEKLNPDKEMRRTMCNQQFREIEVEEPVNRGGVKNAPPEEGVQIEPIEHDKDIDFKNSIDNMNGGSVDIETLDPGDTTGEDTNNVGGAMSAKGMEYSSAGSAVMSQPGLLAAIIGGTVVGLLCAVLLVMFIVYRMRKKDEGSYALDEPKRSPSHHQYQRASNREFYA